MNILHGFKAFAAFALVAVLATGCSEDQTSLDVNSVPGRAKIIGNVAYSEGTILENGQFKEIIKPAANKDIYLEIDNAEFTANSTGVSTWKVRTNETGKFEINIPVPANGATINIQAADFTGKFSQVGIENNIPVMDTINVVYRTSAIQKTLDPHQIAYTSLTYTAVDEELVQKGYNQTVRLEGKIGMGKYLYQAATTTPNVAPKVTPYFDGASNANIILAITYPDDVVNNERFYNLTTGSDGKFGINLPVEDIQVELGYEIYVLPFSGSFTYYTRTNITGNTWGYDFNPTTITGIYEQDFKSSGNLIYTVKDQLWTIKAPVMVLTTPYGDKNYVYDQDEWSGAKWFEDIITK